MRGLALLILATMSFAALSDGGIPSGDRSKLPENLRNLPLRRLSSGALMLLNRDNNLVAPREATTAKGAESIIREATAPVMLDLRIGPNIRLGNDPAALPPATRAQAEPFIARAIGDEDFIVATFQEGRFATSGGAVDCGYSVSHDGGLTWTRALIPNLTMASGGPYFRATDPVVGFDGSGNVYLETLVATDANFNNGAVVVSKSVNGGSAFASPMVAYRPNDNTVFPDKEWMALNTFASTATFGRILVTFTLFSNSNQNVHPIVRTYSDDGGAHWSSVGFVDGNNTGLQGSQPLYLPNGNAVIVYWNFGSNASPGERLESVISTDGGVSFGSPHLISFATEWNEPTIRSGSFLPSAAADRTTGNVYVVYQAVLNGPRIVFTKSTDGGATWSTPAAISDNASGLGVFNPAINVSPNGDTVTVCYYDHRNNPNSTNLVDLYLAQSFDGGTTWQPNIRLTSVSSDATLAPLTSDGYMLGDYLGIAQSTRPIVPAIPVWVDTRSGDPDPFIVRAGIAPYPDLATAWEAAHASVAQIPGSSLRPGNNDIDRDGEDGQSESASGTNAANPGSVTRTGQELNISTRLHVETDERVGIAGFVISGNTSKQVLVRALGPTLSQFNVPNVLLDPSIQIFDSTDTAIASNDNWKSSQQTQIQASGFAPGDDREPALIVTLAPGRYTAIVQGINSTTGTALVEVYDLNPGNGSVIANISTRGPVETGSNVMIGGFVVGDGRGVNGDGSSQVLVRAIGPELGTFNVPNPLQDPTLELHDGNGNLLASNDNWKDSQQSAIQTTGLAPGDDRDSAILTTLIQGNWTAIIRGKNSTTGVGLMEVYRIQ